MAAVSPRGAGIGALRVHVPGAACANAGAAGVAPARTSPSNIAKRPIAASHEFLSLRITIARFPEGVRETLKSTSDQGHPRTDCAWNRNSITFHPHGRSRDWL